MGMGGGSVRGDGDRERSSLRVQIGDRTSKKIQFKKVVQNFKVKKIGDAPKNYSFTPPVRLTCGVSG